MVEKNKSGVYDRLLYWSAESRLDSANHEGDMVRYDYNALGKPVIKYRRGTTSSWYAYSYYIWDGDQLLIELDLNKKRNADFVYYPGTIDQPIAHGIGDFTVTAIRDFRSDAEGNTLATVVDGDYIQSQDTYDAWGTPTHDGQLNSALFWKGLKWEGDAVNLYFVRNRWYDPELGRFASEDPIGHAGGENLYAFANNDPINGRDPSGMVRSDDSPCVMLGWCTQGEPLLFPGGISSGSAQLFGKLGSVEFAQGVLGPLEFYPTSKNTYRALMLSGSNVKNPPPSRIEASVILMDTRKAGMLHMYQGEEVPAPTLIREKFNYSGRADVDGRNYEARGQVYIVNDYFWFGYITFQRR